MRIMYVSSLCVLLGAFATATAAPPPQEIQIPLPPKPIPPPTPPVLPGQKINLVGNAWYVVNSKVECSVRGYPTGLVSIDAKKGPRDISAVFVDGNGINEDRSYDGPFIYVVRASGVGDCALVITPIGLKSDSEIITSNLRVNDGTAPQPPPIVPPVVVEQQGIYIVIIEETGNATQARGQILQDPTLAAHMAAKQEKFRIVDKDAATRAATPPADVVRFLDQAKTMTLPVLFLVDSKGVQIGKGQPCPQTAAGILEALAKVGG